MRVNESAASETLGVPAMYLRDVPEWLVRHVRSQAALKGESMKAYVVRAVKAQLKRDGVELPDEE